MEYIKSAFLGLLFLIHILVLFITFNVFESSIQEYVIKKFPWSPVLSCLGLITFLYLSFLLVRSFYLKKYTYYINRLILLVPLVVFCTSLAITYNSSAYYLENNFRNETSYNLASDLLMISLISFFVTTPIWWTHRKKNNLNNKLFI